MMAILSDDAQTLLDRYLRQVRASMRGHASVDVDDVERDVQGHIDAALAGRPEPVDVGSLREILDRLGAPQQWASADDLPLWRRLLDRWQSGPEDWRLPYLSFAVWLAGPALFLAPRGPLLWPLPVILPIASFMLARASLSVLAAHGESIETRRWLIYPSLLSVYVPLGLLVLGWPIPVFLGAANDFSSVREWLGQFSGGSFDVVAAVAAFGVGVWWVVLGGLLVPFSRAVHAVFWPFAERIGRRHAIALSVAGLVVAAAAAFILAAIES